MQISNQDSFQIEKAICFLCSEYAKSGHNPKPVVLHSMRVAFYLMNTGANAETVITAMLHDLIEDSAVKIEDIEREFGENIAGNVASLSEDENISVYKERYKENFDRIIQRGTEAVAVKLADLYDNGFYLSLTDKKTQVIILDKIADFLDITEGVLAGEIWGMLQEKYKEELYRINEENN
ncbi:MAG: HD domain-containing protein [Candidatus Pacebacteria bacterium]|nr:HD domain-containing protein [Candidatus Paceibacterota bacterium]